MKLKLKRLGSTLIVLLLTYYTVQYLGHLCRPTDSNKNISSINTFHELPQNVVEVVGMGSSQMYQSIDSMQLYSDYGVAFYNYGTAGETIDLTYLHLIDVFKTQSPNLIILSTYLVNCFSNDTLTLQKYYSKSLNVPIADRLDYLEKSFGNDLEAYFSYCFPIVGLHDNWVSINKKSFDDLSSGTYSNLKNMGFRRTKRCEEIKIAKTTGYKQNDVSDEGIEYLEKIFELCKEHDCELLLYMAPSAIKYRFDDAMSCFAEEHDIGYINIFHHIKELGISGKTDFLDSKHTNVSGAAKITDYIGEYIIDNYDLTDMRTVEGNIWEQQLNK